MERSPFVFQQPVAPAQFRGRDEEVGQVVESARSGTALTLTGPRRYGKTSLLLAAAEQLAAGGHLVVHVDLYGTASLAELAVRLERAWGTARPRWRRAANRILEATQLGLSLSGAGIGVTFARQPRTDPLPALHALLALPVQLGKPDSRVVMMLDEFQSLADLRGAEALLRSHLQHHREHAAYVFAGSEPHLLHRQFQDPDRPLYGQALWLRIGRPGRPALRTTIEEGFAATRRSAGIAVEPLLDLAEDHPQRAMMLAHFLWRRTSSGGTAQLAEWEEALDETRRYVAGEVEARYERATRNQQRVLRAVANHRSPFTVDAQATFGLESGSVSKTIEQALRDGLVEHRTSPPGSRPSSASYRLIDPMLADWIRRRFPL